MADVVQTFEVRIFMAGDIETAQRWLRHHAYQNGLCATITPTTFIYTGGEETGFVVGLVNYPRFPTTRPVLRARALMLAEALVIECCQRTALVVADDETTWIQIPPPGTS